jgi:Mg-chelatase subunit ChlD
LIVSNKASVKQELTPVFESFRQQLDKVSAGGDTAVYDALDSARQMLVNYRSDLPKLRKRIIIVTDGSDTSSVASAREVCHALQKNSIIVDSVQVGRVPDSTLHSISIATGKDLS